MGFPRQEYWSGLPFPSPGDLLDTGIKPISPALAGGVFITEPLGKPTCVGTWPNLRIKTLIRKRNMHQQEVLRLLEGSCLHYTQFPFLENLNTLEFTHRCCSEALGTT